MSSATWRRASAWYLGAALAASAAHPLLPPGLRAAWFITVSGAAIGPAFAALRATPRRLRTPFWLLVVAVALLVAGNGLGTVLGDRGRPVSESILAGGHCGLLAAVLALVLMRGRRDVGGLLDASIVAMGTGGLLWTCVLQPRLAATGATAGQQAALLATVLLLGGLLGALIRLWRTCPEPLRALRLMVYATALALVSDVTLAVTNGAVASGRTTGIEVLLMAAYSCLGASVLHPSSRTLLQPAAAIHDTLGLTRLVFLGIALALGPVAGGVRQLVGLPVDGMLIAGGTLAVVPLAMLRIGWLSARRQAAERALAHQATHDTLTGLPNRAEFLSRLGQALRAHANAPPGSGVVVLFCDLNGFKAVNDRLGHTAGDQLLVQVATRLSGALRAADTLARYGGDEFLALCAGVSRDDVLLTVCPRIREVMAVPFEVSGVSVTLGASVGLVAAEGETDAGELIHRADAAMYRAKQQDGPDDQLCVAVA